jgi:hypothetical protein
MIEPDSEGRFRSENAFRVHMGELPREIKTGVRTDFYRLPYLDKKRLRTKGETRENFALGLLVIACGFLAWQFGKAWDA